MTREATVRWLALLGERRTGSRGKWVTAHCLLAPWRHGGGSDRHPSFGVESGPGVGRVHCFSCSYTGNQVSLLIELSRLLRGRRHDLDLRGAMAMAAAAEDEVDGSAWDWDPEAVDDRADSRFPEAWLDAFPRAWHGRRSHPYLASRGVPGAVAEALDLRIDPDEGRACFPVRDWDGRLVGLHGRAWDPDAVPRYRMYTYLGQKSPLAWLGEDWIDPSRPVVVVESVFDLASVYRTYRNVACPLTASVDRRKARRVECLQHVVLMMDGDEAGSRASRYLASVLGSGSVVESVEVPEGRDPGSMSVAEVSAVLAPLVALDAPIY